MDERQTDPDRAAILARRQRFAALVLAGSSTGCLPCLSISDHTLRPGGMYLCEAPGCEGCTELERGDLVRRIDGVGVHDAADLDTRLRDGQTHSVSIFDQDVGNLALVELRLSTDAPPLCSINSIQLDRAPDWARRALFGHQAPRLPLIDEEGLPLEADALRGRRWLIVAFDWTTGSQRQNAALMLQVLQKAQADLRAKNVELVFAQIPEASNKESRTMSDVLLRQFAVDNQVSVREGGPLPLPPLYHSPTKVQARHRSFLEQLGESPNVLILDERGAVRWHSAGVTPDPSGEIPVDAVYTINAAVLFARDQL